MQKSLFKSLYLICLITIISSASCNDRSELPNDLMNTTEGYYKGEFESPFIISFKGVPYAKPPIKDLRFENPVKPDSFSGTRQANQIGAVCPQFDPNQLLPTMIGDEDCLFLNIFRPSAEGEYPVMVWIHGGGFTKGDSMHSLHGAENLSWYGQPYRLVDSGIVFISINYRLGVFGFLASRDTAEEDAANGNYGLSDQQQALKWIRNNANSFDGDPNNITIFGESSGGLSVLTHFSMPSSDGLFNRGIIQSGVYDYSQSSNLDDAIALGKIISDKLGCTQLSEQKKCLKLKSKEEILTIQHQLNYSPYPVAGINTLEINPVKISDKDFFNSADLIVGTNSEEGNFFTPINEFTYGNSENSELGYSLALKKQLSLDNSTVEIVKTVYPLISHDNTTHKALSKIITDAFYACPTLKLSRNLRKKNKVYFYTFDDRNAPYAHILGTWPLYSNIPLPDKFNIGASHTLEISYVLGDKLDQLGFSKEQILLANKMTDYWSTFAKFGNPNFSHDAFNWNTFDQKKILSLGDTIININVAEFSINHNCDNFWLFNQ